MAEGRKHVLLDVRVEVQFAVCALDNAVNVPLSQLEVRTRTRVLPRLEPHLLSPL